MNIKKIEFDYINNKITFITDENYKCGVANAIYKYIFR